MSRTEAPRLAPRRPPQPGHLSPQTRRVEVEGAALSLTLMCWEPPPRPDPTPSPGDLAVGGRPVSGDKRTPQESLPEGSLFLESVLKDVEGCSCQPQLWADTGRWRGFQETHRNQPHPDEGDLLAQTAEIKQKLHLHVEVHRSLITCLFLPSFIKNPEGVLLLLCGGNENEEDSTKMKKTVPAFEVLSSLKAQWRSAKEGTPDSLER